MITIFLITLIFLIILLYPTMIENIKKYNNGIKIRFRKRVRKKCKNYWQLFYGKRYKDITCDKMVKSYNDIRESLEKDVNSFKHFTSIYITIFISIYGLVYFIMKLIYPNFFESLDSIKKNFNVISEYYVSYIIFVILFVLLFIVFINIYELYNVIKNKEKHLYILRSILQKKDEDLYLYDKKHTLESHTFFILSIAFINLFVFGYILAFVGSYHDYFYKIISTRYFLYVLLFQICVLICFFLVAFIKYKSRPYSYILKTKIIKL